MAVALVMPSVEEEDDCSMWGRRKRYNSLFFGKGEGREAQPGSVREGGEGVMAAHSLTWPPPGDFLLLLLVCLVDEAPSSSFVRQLKTPWRQRDWAGRPVQGGEGE